MVSLPTTTTRAQPASAATDSASGSFSIAGNGAIGRAVLQAFADNPSLETAFAIAYAREMENRASADGLPDASGTYSGSGAASRAAAHDALVATILANRASFPPQSFKLHTDFGNGAAIATEIPQAGTTAVRRTGADAASGARPPPTVQAVPSPDRLSAQARVASAAVLGDDATAVVLLAVVPDGAD